ARARSVASAEGRVSPGPEGPRPPAPAASAVGAAGVSIKPHAAPAVAVPLPAGAVQIDSAWYDLQDMGSLGHRIEVGADGRVHVTWQDDFWHLGRGSPPNRPAPHPCA